MLVGQQLKDIFDDFGSFWQSLVSEDQIRWVCVFNFWEARFHDKLEIYAVHHVIIVYSITQQEILIYLFFSAWSRKRSDSLSNCSHCKCIVGFMGQNWKQGCFLFKLLLFVCLFLKINIWGFQKLCACLLQHGTNILSLISIGCNIICFSLFGNCLWIW